MSHSLIVYLCFGVVLLISIILDISFFARKNKVITFRTALLESAGWVIIGLAFGFFIYCEQGKHVAFDYWSAYLTEWSLSIDNIFLFILLFKSFHIKEKYVGRALMWGILLAIILRVLLIAVGIELIQRWEWILYIFGLFLLYAGFKFLWTKNHDSDIDYSKKGIAKILFKVLKVHPSYEGNAFIIKENNQYYSTSLFVVVLMLMFIDIVFAIDSIPATLAITQVPIAVYLSNIFAVLGLRPMYFVLKQVVDKFKFLNYGISFILIFIGIKICLPFLECCDIYWCIPSTFSFGFILSVLFLSIIISMLYNKRTNQSTDA